jgi:mannose-6-phosphate isomerase-like protein (cupin superfamily)
MSDYTAKRIGDMEAGFGGGFVKARAELGVNAFGMQVIQMPPNYDGYPEHDHSDSGQEEVFVTLGGSGWMDVAGDHVDLDPETVVRVGSDVKRKIYAGPEGIRVLALGGCPGEGYKAPEMTELTGSAA